jgi:amino acid transporter
MATDTPPAAPPSLQGRSLKRRVGLIGLLWASEGSIIGSGWLFGARNALEVAGPAALISWGVATVIIVILALVHAELGGMFPVAGGTARFPHYAFGGATGATFGWFSWLQAASVAPVEVTAMITYAQSWSTEAGWSWAHFTLNFTKANGTLTGSGLVTAIVLMAIFVGINFLGIRWMANVNNVATWWKVGIPLLAIFTLAAISFHTSNLSANGGFLTAGWKNILVAIPGTGIVFSLLGFEQAIQLAGESENPKKHLPRATILSIFIGAAIYILVQLVFILALKPAALAGGWSATDSASFTQFGAPIAGVATAAGATWLATILFIDAVISPGGTALIYATSTSRISYGLARNGYVPDALSKTNKQGAPWLGLIVAFIAGCIFFLPFPSWQSLVDLITSASVFMYAAAPLAFGAFRSRLPDQERPYRLPFGNVIAPIAFILANEIILWSGWDTIYKLFISVAIGYIVLGGNRLFRLNPIKPELHLRSAVWVPLYFIGMLLITWQSKTFDLSNAVYKDAGWGSPKSPALSFGVDMGLVAVLSLIVYYWAMYTALPKETIELMIEEVVIDEEAITA